MKKKIIAVCQDPGAASAIAPVIIGLHRLNKYNLLVIGYQYSQKVYRDKGIAFSTFEELGIKSTDNGQLSVFLDKQKPSLLLLGTSEVGDYLEKDLTCLAREKNIKTLAVLDYWSNYWQRFSDRNGKNRLGYMPDFIAVMDDFAREEMLKEGFDGRRLLVTAQPYFDSIKADYAKFAKSDKERFLKSLGVSTDGLFIVMASQPIEKYRGADSGKPDFLGFTEKTSRDILIDALNSIKAWHNINLTLFIKLHPKEDLGSYNIIKKCNFPVLVNQDADSRKLIFSADIVTGITSVFMVEAMFAQKMVISIQPNLIKKDFLFTNRLGLTMGVYKPKDLEPVLERAIFDEKFRKDIKDKQCQYLHSPDATDNICKAIESIIG